MIDPLVPCHVGDRRCALEAATTAEDEGLVAHEVRAHQAPEPRGLSDSNAEGGRSPPG